MRATFLGGQVGREALLPGRERGASCRVEPSTLNAGRGAGRGKSAVVPARRRSPGRRARTSRREVVPGAGPPPATCRTPCGRARRSRPAPARGGRCRSGSRPGRRRRAARRARRRAAASCRRSCAPCGAEQPGGADDRVRAGAARGDGALAGELRAPVGRARAGRVGLARRARRVAVEDVVGRDVDDGAPARPRRRRDVAGAVAVDRGRRRLLGLGAVDVGPGRAVDDRVGARVADRGADGLRVGDVEVGAGERDDVVRGARRRTTSCAEHARGARDEKAHGDYG